MHGRLDGPRLAPQGGTADSLIVLLHGYGSDGEDLIGLAAHWRALLPHSAFVAPHAPEPCAMAPMGYQWFPIGRIDPAEIAAGVASAAPGLARFLDDELARHGLPPERLALVGFSQGTMMALHVGLRRPQLAAIVGFSGALAAPDVLAAERRSAPPVCLIHGELDQTIPVEAMLMAAESLAAAGVPVRWHTSPNIAHGVGQDGLEIGGTFLKDALAGAFANGASAPLTHKG